MAALSFWHYGDFYSAIVNISFRPSVFGARDQLELMLLLFVWILLEIIFKNVKDGLKNFAEP